MANLVVQAFSWLAGKNAPDPVDRTSDQYRKAHYRAARPGLYTTGNVAAMQKAAGFAESQHVLGKEWAKQWARMDKALDGLDKIANDHASQFAKTQQAMTDREVQAKVQTLKSQSAIQGDLAYLTGYQKALARGLDL